MSTQSPHDLWPTVETPIGLQHTFAEPPIPDYIASSKSKEWYTPKWLLEEVYKVLGEIDLDPASPPPPYTDWVKARRHITEQAGTSLGATWRGSVFLNPPYGRAIGSWVAKLAELHALRYVTEAILLVPARTDARWFEDVWAADALCFIKGRLKFEVPATEANPDPASNSAPFPSVLAYYGIMPQKFESVFSRYGWICRSDR